MPLKNAGMGYTIGYFCWGMGKEFYAYQNGDISYETFAKRAQQRGKNAVGQTLMVPVNMLVLKIVRLTTLEKDPSIRVINAAARPCTA